MALVLTSPPAVEPVSLSEAKAHLRVDGTDEDVLITALILSARKHLETWLARSLITQSWRLMLDDWPHSSTVDLPLSPLQSIEAVETYDADDVATPVAALAYFVDTVSDPARLVRISGDAWPAPGRAANGVEIRFTAGYGDAASNVPQPLRQALHLLVAHWFERRESVPVENAGTLAPFSVASLISPYRRVRV